MTAENPAVFVARDSEQRRRLLTVIGCALDWDRGVRYVAKKASEGDETSSYLFSFFDQGWLTGYRHGCREGIDVAYDHVYGRKASDVEARTRARRARRRAAGGRK